MNHLGLVSQGLSATAAVPAPRHSKESSRRGARFMTLSDASVVSRLAGRLQSLVVSFNDPDGFRAHRGQGRPRPGPLTIRGTLSAKGSRT